MNIRQPLTIGILLILIMLESGCSSILSNSPEGVQSEPAPSDTDSNVETSITSTPSFNLTPKPTLISRPSCQQVTSKNQLSTVGFLVITDGKGAYYSIDMQKMEVERFAQNSMQIAFSTNYQAFVYSSMQEGSQQLVIKSLQGTTVLPWKSNWYSIARWLDEENIQINEENSLTSPQIILDPFTGNSTRITPDFDDVYNLDSNNNWNGLSLVSYSSNLRFVVYPRLEKDGPALILMPTQASGLRARLYPIDITSYPQWSPFGEFVIGEPLGIDDAGQLMGYELFLVGLGGDIRKVTTFSETYDYPLIKSYRWSPKYGDISFWFTENIHEQSGAYLGITNAKDQRTLLMCITANNVYFAVPPVWSPDGGFLAVKANIDGSENLIIIDRESLEYKELSFDFDVTPVGWVSFMP